jgi:esterase/lipase
MRKLGAIPHNHPRLMSIMGDKLKEGYKIIIFPQGMMVKDHECIDMKSGGAVLALGIDVYKRFILENKHDFSVKDIEFANRPTIIVPCNISYYPLCVKPNAASRMGEKHHLPKSMIEELTVEGNILLKHTKMNVNFGDPITVDSSKIDISRVTDLQSSFSLIRNFKNERQKLKEDYEEIIYENLIINQGHVFSGIIFNLLNSGERLISKFQLESANEIACGDLLVDYAQKDHDNLVDMSVSCGLIREENYNYVLLENILSDNPFNFVRIINPLRVYYNELSPIKESIDIINSAITGSKRVTKRGFILEPSKNKNNSEAVVIIHGLFATPNQVRTYAEKFRDRGYTVYAPLISGHGTCKEDLESKTHRDWYHSIEDSLPRNNKFHLVGFSTGGLLAAEISVKHTSKVLSLTTVCTPQHFVSKSGMYLSRILKTVKFPKYWHNRDNPETYDHIPLNTLCELQDYTKESKNIFSEVSIPISVYQSTDDKIVESLSGQTIAGQITKSRCYLNMVESDKHDLDIVGEDIFDFIGEIHGK